LDDVIVVGAGPAGNNTALSLARKGYSVTVIDWRTGIGNKVCTGIIGQECARRFPVDPELIYREACSAQVIAPSAPPVRFDTPTPKAKIIDRVAYVASFAQRAQSEGARYLLGQRVVKVERDDQRVTVATEEGVYHARSLVLAAGFGSSLTRQLGLGSVPDHVAGVQASVETSGVEEIEVHLGHDVAPGFFAWLAPTTPGRALAGLMSRRQAPEYLAAFISRQTALGRITSVIDEPACWGVPLRPLKRTFGDRVLVVGDAAGQVKPATGGGIFYSLLCSEIAAETLAHCLDAGDLSAGNLSQYHRRWRELLSHELEVGYSARRLFEFLNDRQIGALTRRAVAAGVPKDLTSSPDVSFDWHSRAIAKVMGNSTLGGALRLINPMLARFAGQPEPNRDSEFPWSRQLKPMIWPQHRNKCPNDPPADLSSPKARLAIYPTRNLGKARKGNFSSPAALKLRNPSSAPRIGHTQWQQRPRFLGHAAGARPNYGLYNCRRVNLDQRSAHLAFV